MLDMVCQRETPWTLRDVSVSPDSCQLQWTDDELEDMCKLMTEEYLIQE